jgi:hypothetical protein
VDVHFANYQLVPEWKPLTVRCIHLPQKERIVLEAQLPSDDNPLVEYPAYPDARIALAPHLSLDGPELGTLVDPASKAVQRKSVANTVVTRKGWALRPGAALPESLDVVISCDLTEHMPHPYIRKTSVTTIEGS